MALKADALRYAVRPRVLAKYFGQVCLVLSLLTVAPLLVSVFADEPLLMSRYFAVALVLAGIGWILSRLKAPARVQANEGMVLVALTFLVGPILSTYTFMGSGIGFEEALFEAISGITTTGLTALGHMESRSPTFLFARAWIQWYGGLGIVVLSLAFVTQPGLATKGLATTENIEDNLIGGIKAYAWRILVVYVSLTAVGYCVLWLTGIPAFPALLYTLSAISTGGFAPNDASLAALHAWPAQTAVIVLCLSGALPLALFYGATQIRRIPSANRAQLYALGASGIVLCTLLLLICTGSEGLTGIEAFRSTMFLAVSAQTTAGFSTMDMAGLVNAVKLILIASMIIGGSTGSTAGGIKLFRLLIVLQLIRVVVLRACLPRHAVWEVRIAGRRIGESEIREALVLIVLFVILIGLSWFPFIAMGYDPLDSLFEIVSATGTVGLSAGITAPELPAILKSVLCADMLLGRLEIVTWLVFAYPGTWIGRRLEEA